jgi:hypothetical protein
MISHRIAGQALSPKGEGSRVIVHLVPSSHRQRGELFSFSNILKARKPRGEVLLYVMPSFLSCQKKGLLGFQVTSIVVQINKTSGASFCLRTISYHNFHFPKPRRYILRVRSYPKRQRMVQRGRIEFNVISLIISEKELLQRQVRATPGDIKWNHRGKHFLQTVKATSTSVSQNYRGHIPKWLVS